jgi:hypothetical protein
MDGIRKKDGKYEAIPNWGDEDRKKQKSNLDKDKGAMDRWDEGGRGARNPVETRGLKRGVEGEATGFSHPSFQPRLEKNPVFIFGPPTVVPPPSKKPATIINTTTEQSTPTPSYASKVKEGKKDPKTQSHATQSHASPEPSSLISSLRSSPEVVQLSSDEENEKTPTCHDGNGQASRGASSDDSSSDEEGARKLIIADVQSSPSMDLMSKIQDTLEAANIAMSDD